MSGRRSGQKHDLGWNNPFGKADSAVAARARAAPTGVREIEFNSERTHRFINRIPLCTRRNLRRGDRSSDEPTRKTARPLVKHRTPCIIGDARNPLPIKASLSTAGESLLCDFSLRCKLKRQAYETRRVIYRVASSLEILRSFNRHVRNLRPF